MKTFDDLKMGSSVWTLDVADYKLNRRLVSFLDKYPNNGAPLSMKCLDNKNGAEAVASYKGVLTGKETRLQLLYGHEVYFNQDDAIKEIKKIIIDRVQQQRKKIIDGLDEIDKLMPMFLKFAPEKEERLSDE